MMAIVIYGTDYKGVTKAWGFEFFEDNEFMQEMLEVFLLKPNVGSVLVIY